MRCQFSVVVEVVIELFKGLIFFYVFFCDFSWVPENYRWRISRAAVGCWGSWGLETQEKGIKRDKKGPKTSQSSNAT